jgi:dethiobiotin synthetase
MKEIYFITATNTNVGKTKACEVFLNKFASKNKKVGYFKPIETGVVDKPEDGTAMFNLTKSLNKDFKHLTIKDIVPYQFKLPAAPFVANKEKINIDINYIKEKIKYLLTLCDVLIIEGAGGLYVPIKKNYFMYDLIADINPTNTFLIVPSKLGSINETMLNINFLKQKEIQFDWFINLYEDKKDFNKITLPFYNAYFDKIAFLQKEYND